MAPEQPPKLDPANLSTIPCTYQALTEMVVRLKNVNLFALRKETFIRIEKITGRPLLCYVTKTHDLPLRSPAYIDDSDLVGITDLLQTVNGTSVDFLLISNGGKPEPTERIVRLLRDKFTNVRFIVPGNAYSAATLLCFSGDEILMDSQGTLGPVDPQINGIPARAIQRAFEGIEERLKVEGPKALTAYLPLLQKYDLHLLEMCKSAQKLSEELARNWLGAYMLKCDENDDAVQKIVSYFVNYDELKSHGRSIDRNKARELGVKVVNTESIEGLCDLIRSLYNQYVLWFEKTPFYKLFENAHGINWGRQLPTQTFEFQIPVPVPGQPVPIPLPGQPKSNKQ